MSDRQRVRRSKLLSLVLRHQPERFGIQLDSGGWTDVEQLLAALARHGTQLSYAELEDVVSPRAGEKHRFELAGGRIRARYGHSVAVDPGYPAVDPPGVLYHGTSPGSLPAILREGISPMGRQLVHLSEDVASASQVGARRGRPVVLEVDAAGMAADGAVFHRLPGGVWLTARVPAERVQVADPERPLGA